MNQELQRENQNKNILIKNNSILELYFRYSKVPVIQDTYLDDVIIFSKTLREHEKHVEQVLNKLKAANISLNKKKCKFGLQRLKILGTIISKNKIKPDTDKVSAIKEYPLPWTVNEVRLFSD